MSNLASILNPAAAAGGQVNERQADRRESKLHDSSQSPELATRHQLEKKPSLPPLSTAITTTTHEAASALTALATAMSPSSYAPYNQSYSATHESYANAYESGDVRRSSASIPQPSSPPRKSYSPDLERYHHQASRSPDAQRAPSLTNANPPATVLAPLQNLHAPSSNTGKSEERFGEEGYSFDNTRSDNTHNSSALDHSAQHNLLENQHAHSERSLLSGLENYTKSEGPTASRDGTPTSAKPKKTMDHETQRAIEELQREDRGLRTGRVKTKGSPSPTSAAPASAAPAPAPVRKKPGPKKGIAKATPTSKKRKAEDSPLTPSSNIATTAVAGKGRGKLQSNAKPSATPTPLDSPRPGSDDDEDDDEGDEQYCICRKPDNHTWMIACDGGCDDWYHGACVGIKQADGDLIDRYICPSCETSGEYGVTNWKPMCRNLDCRRPARLRKGAESKYCSDECAKDFWERMIERAANSRHGEHGEKKKRRKMHRADHVMPSHAHEEEERDDLVTTRGGAVTTGQLRVLVDESVDVHSFRSLGNGVPSPPPTRNGEEDDNAMLRDGDAQRIAAIKASAHRLGQQFELLKQREKFLTLVKHQQTILCKEEGVKDLCGYDSRLGWSDTEFQSWCESPAGRAAMDSGRLAPALEGGMKDEDVAMSPPSPSEVSTICRKTRRKCGPRHGEWQRMERDALVKDRDAVSAEMRALYDEEQAVRRRAVLRFRSFAGQVRDGLAEGVVEEVGRASLAALAGNEVEKAAVGVVVDEEGRRHRISDTGDDRANPRSPSSRSVSAQRDEQQHHQDVQGDGDWVMVASQNGENGLVQEEMAVAASS